MVAIHQPQYLPWLGYFDKIDRADRFVFLDNVQYKKNEWQNRNRIRTSQGWQWVTVPVLYSFPQKIREVKINNGLNWRKKHLHALTYNYSRAAYFKDFIGFFEETYNREWSYLVDINIHIIRYLVEALGIETEVFLASELSPSEDPTGRLIDICKSLGADTYLSGVDGVKYMDMERFEREGIRVVVQDFKHPTYNQNFKGFIPNMSVVDLLFNHGDRSLEILRSTR